MSRLKLHGNEKILIIRPDRIGDLVLTLPVASLLKKAYPGLTIHFLASSYNASILKYARYVDNIILMTDALGNPLNIGRLIEILEVESYDIALFVKPGWRSALAVYLADVPLRSGTSRRFYSFLFNRRVNITRRNSNEHEVDLNLKMLRVFGLNISAGTIIPELAAELPEWRSIAGLTESMEFVVIHPGSKGSAPNWPRSFYLELIKKMAENYKVVITGQGNEMPELPKGTINLINKTGFAQLISILSKARLVINTSFLTPSKQIDHICSINDDGSCECMKNIDIQTVYESAHRIIEQGSSL